MIDSILLARPWGGAQVQSLMWCVFIKGHSYNLCDAASRAMDRALHNVDYYYGLTDMDGLTIQHVIRNKQQYAN